ncbi:restriction endonuclease subunit S [Bacteroides fragilis]|uniref:Type I restriction modification DNA specificity domain protein n=2 Tax=Bacteroidaceae TaxID=815 RepID=A0A975KH78_9BACE|nr:MULTISPECIES: restriction endonuclease subunit S [Bacteroidales]RJV59074.1 restriction endonuclease subunit S [Bacteroides sp. AF16-29]RJX06438.1 restriction endonuclease subunit S [Bacteroides sp. AF15-23LB]MBV3103940.1 restriction endonuclease subunit S [Bacteroides thetaiotaomicron]MCA6032425.1 restriction endonuclease subunit S [Bacteroides thetaiotaomicron]MCL0402500.1 restriction endonuclease subunit S [Bacteroides fragilis]
MADNNENKVLNVPHLRFPEFSGEWNKYTINDLATVVGGGTPDTTVKSYWGGDIQWFTPSEIGKNKYVDFSKRTITRDGLDNSSAKLLPLHTILLSSRATVGECSIASNECTTNQGFQSLIAKQCNIDFLYYLIQTKKKDLIRNACGSTFLEISANEIRKIKVAVPVQNEQEQIAKLLSLIDERIATQNKIIEKLQSLIKGLAAQLTQSGTPNIRLCDCLECHSSTLQENCVSVTGSYPVYGATGLIGYTNNYAYNGESILIVKDGSGVGSLSYVNDHFSVIGTLNYLTAKENYSILYLYYALMAFNFTPYITGMAIPHIYFKDYGKAKLFYPSIEKRIRIASLLHNIEQKLVVEQNLVISLSAQKSYLLRMLFI